MAGWAKALHTRTVCPGELQVHEHVTLIPPDAAAPRSRGLGSTLPPDLLDQVRARVRVLGLLMMISFAIDPVLFFSGAIAMRLNEGAFPTDFFRDAVFYYGDIGVVAASVVLWRMAKSSRVPVARLYALGLMYEVAVCFVLSLRTYWEYYGDTGMLPNLTWVPAIIILFPLVLPAPPRLMLELQSRLEPCSHSLWHRTEEGVAWLSGTCPDSPDRRCEAPRPHLPEPRNRAVRSSALSAAGVPAM
jgi:hypothetical protein